MKDQTTGGRGVSGGVQTGSDGSGADAEAAWARVRARLRAEFGDAAFKSWLRPLTLKHVRDQRVYHAVTTRFMRDWVAEHYGEPLLSAWQQEFPSVEGIDIYVDSSIAPEPEKRPLADLETEAGQKLDPATTAAVAEVEANGDYAGQLDPRLTFDEFVVGKPNELAHAAALRVADAKAVPFNPLYLYGGVGLGKTHLMHAIAWRIRERDPERKVVYLSAERFMVQFVRALRYKDTVAFKEAFRSVDVLMIDDIQFIAGKNSTQEEFFHTFNALIDQNRQVVISADRSPVDLEGLEERLRSRLGWGLVADLHPTTYELRLGILQAKAAHVEAKVPEQVIEFLAHKISSNVRALEGALNRIVAFGTLVGREISIEMAQEVLKDVLRANDRHITIDEIQKKVCTHYNIRIADMHSPRRARAIARPRQVAMYLAKLLTTRSYPEIGRKFGNRDHTTVMHAVKKIEELLAVDSQLAEDIDLLKRMLES